MGGRGISGRNSERKSICQPVTVFLEATLLDQIRITAPEGRGNDAALVAGKGEADEKSRADPKHGEGTGRELGTASGVLVN